MYISMISNVVVVTVSYTTILKGDVIPTSHLQSVESVTPHRDSISPRNDSMGHTNIETLVLLLNLKPYSEGTQPA